MEFEWKNFSGFTTLGILDEIQKTMTTELKCEPEHFKGRIIFMSMYNDIDWGKRGNKENCISNAHRVTEYARRFTRGCCSSLGPGSEKKWNGTHVNKPDGERDKTAEGMMLNFAESGHPTFRGTSASGRGELKSQRERNEIHSLQRNDETIWLILRTVSQLSVYGAVADMCGRTNPGHDSCCILPSDA